MVHWLFSLCTGCRTSHCYDFDYADILYAGWLQVLLLCLLALAMSVEMLGEELGWMGYLFPKLESLHGTSIAIVLIGLIIGGLCYYLLHKESLIIKKQAS